ncbi:PREDICTED: tetratricopeptide repeat protein 25-like [Habropoda laboriosa]|uniref:tetratricopeptide repeat protein 25-like n=1 Tax=Habropoda laboriosa TaxID=597456 RepID=UPI00083D074F|nr:PREDICTED: tetratricopeptide repeat protein 25-like [Habropoda laboriosa]
MAVLTSIGLKDDLPDLNDTRKAIENAESRALLDHRKFDSKVPLKNNREYAQALHREADQLYRSGDYETALVLYHRAANLYPRDSSHCVAARRTAATISSCNNPSKALPKVLPGLGAADRLTIALCPETAAIMVNEKLKKSPVPSSVTELLGYFDNHKSYWKTLPSSRISNTQLARSKMMIKQLNNLAESSLKNLQASFDSGKMSTALKTAQDLLELSAGFPDPTRYQIAAYHYLSMIHVALGRHDRAVCNSSRLVRLSKGTGDVIQICRSLVTLGKVHLSFGHLEAAAKAWEHLSKDLKESIPVAWIHHEIGRCYLETGKYEKAMEMGVRCVQAAVKGKSKKWMLCGKLLIGQSLAKLGRFLESLEELQVAAKITEEEGDTPLLSYIRDLIDQVARLLRPIPFEKNCSKVTEARITSSQEENDKNEEELRTSLFVSCEETVITTMFSQRRVITKRRNDSSDEEEASVDGDEQITTYSGNTANLMQSYRESAAPSDLEDEQGGSTFRVANEEEVSSSSTSLLSSSSSSSSKNDIESTEREEEAEILEEINTLNRGSGSKVSLKSADTSVTYIIEDESCNGKSRREILSSEQVERVINDDDEDDKGSERVRYSELGEKDEVELLEMVRFLVTDGEGLGNSGDGFQTPRSGRDRENEVGVSRACLRTSLPATPRKCDADGDFQDCEDPLNVGY